MRRDAKAGVGMAQRCRAARPGNPARDPAEGSGDLDVVVGRLRRQYLGQGDAFRLATLIEPARTSEGVVYAQTLGDEGGWADVDYGDRTSSANTALWQPYLALYRMIAMAQAYRGPNNPGSGRADLLTALDRALRHWDRVRPESDNWWENEIGTSLAMGRVTVLVGDVLPPEALAVGLRHNVGTADPVGANGSWRTGNLLTRAVSARDTATLAAGLATLAATVAVDDSAAVAEAVQPDGTLWVHGRMLYNEFYGVSLVQNVATWADAVRDTPFAFGREALDAVAFLVLDGTRWMLRGNFGLTVTLYKKPPTAQGVTSVAADLLRPLEQLARADPANAAAYTALHDNIAGRRAGNGVTGDRYFWRGEFSSHITDDYAIMTRLNSSRSKGGEYRSIYRRRVGNEMFWSASGTTAIHVGNHEYAGLGPAFDWLRHPGTTAPLARQPDTPAITNAGSFTGGASDGTRSVLVQTLDRAATTAKQAYFHVDSAMVALGAGITSAAAEPVVTTVNQAVGAPDASLDGVPVPAVPTGGGPGLGGRTTTGWATCSRPSRGPARPPSGLPAGSSRAPTATARPGRRTRPSPSSSSTAFGRPARTTPTSSSRPGTPRRWPPTRRTRR
ncbi:hypothetical protein GCM10009609_65580 [Pseudonocardia aurantiaca]